MASVERKLGSSRPRKCHSAIPISNGVDARKTMNVSTLACCSVFMLVKMHARKAAATGKKHFAFPRSSSSTSMRPAMPASFTDTQDDTDCASSKNEGAGRKCTASLLMTSMMDEQAPYPTTAKTTDACCVAVEDICATTSDSKRCAFALFRRRRAGVAGPRRRNARRSL